MTIETQNASIKAGKESAISDKATADLDKAKTESGKSPATSKASSKTRLPHQVGEPQRHPDPERARFYTGSTYEDFAGIILGQVCNTLFLSTDEETEHTQKRAALAAIAGIAPKDETEGMLAAQMVACHHAAMDCFRRAMIPNQTFAGRQQCLNYGAKLMRTYALHMEALDKHRGKGQQTVRVEHVTVNAGGQAIVGHVEHKPGGGSSEEPAE